MDQALKTMLLAQATAEVISFVRTFADMEADREKTLEFANELGYKFGLPKIEVTQMFDTEFAKSKSQFDLHIENMAKAEVSEAVKQAECEQLMYTSKRDELNQMLVEQMVLIGTRAASIDKVLDNGFHDKLEEQIRSSHAGLMKIVQEMHRGALRFVFSLHLIEQETAAKLVDLYEVK
ncbi:MAG TPA: hypothetical protein VIJ88_00510 [Candidatus Paceibacterota bacterium]